MISREEKNKKIFNEIRREKALRISRKVFKIFGIIILIFSILFLYTYYLGPKGLKTKEFLLNDSSIPYSFHGQKILHFSDILYGKTIHEKELNNLLEEIKKNNPDIVIFTGNIIHPDYSINEDEINLINSFFQNIPERNGKYAIKGDQDNANFDLILDNTNFTILDTEIFKLYNDQNDLIQIIGINTNEVKEIKNDSNVFTITIINNYDDYEKYNLTSNIVLAGHNLGGEIRLFNLPLLGMDKHLESYYEKNNTKVYISNGLGSIHHMRFMNKPSINVYRLYVKK